MYTFDYFVFGHELSVNKDLNNDLSDFDLEFRTNKIGNKRFVVEFPYHGGRCCGGIYPVIFGTIITDNDNNQNFVDEVRLSKEEDYLEDYNLFLEEFIKDSLSQKGIDEDYDIFIDKLIDFLRSTKPKFYQVESSS